MNVLLVTDAFPPGAGGSGRSAAHLARGLARRGHRVRVVVGRTASRKLGRTEWEGVPVSEVEVPDPRAGNVRERENAFADGLRAAIGEEAWDLAHAQHWLSAAATQKALPHLPSVVTVRDYWPVCVWSTKLSGCEPCPGCSYTRRVVCVGRRRPWAWPLAPLLPPLVGAALSRRRELLGSASAVTAVSRFVAEELSASLAIEAKVVPNLLDMPSLEATSSSPPPSGVGRGYVLFVGKLEPNKAPERLLPVMDEAGCELPLVVLGTGRLERPLRKQAERSGRDVRFLGWLPEEEVLVWMRHATAVLFPSRWQEPLSRVLLDGIGLGAVLVVEPTGGTPDLVVDGESGLLGTSVSELGRALRRVLEEPELAERLRAGARSRAKKLFSEESVLPGVEEVYRSVAEP